MNILQRYVLKELILPFTLSFLVLSFIFMGGYLARAAHFIIGRGVPLEDTLYILLLAMPGMIGYTLPTSILIAVLMVIGTFSQNNELRAMKASGIQLLKVLMPAFVAGIILSFGMLVFNDQITSNTKFELRRAMKKMVVHFPKALIEPGRFVKLNDQIIFMTKRMEGEKLYDIVAYEIEEEDKPVRTIIAQSGEILADEDSAEVQIKLYNGSISDSEEQSLNTMQFETYEFPSMGEEDLGKMQKKKKDLSIAEIILQLEEGEADAEGVRELWTAFHGRIAFSLASFIFVLIGIPVAMLVRRGEIVLSFAFAMASVSVYYVLFAGAKSLAHSDVLPVSLVMWIPNVVLITLGVILLRRALFT